MEDKRNIINPDDQNYYDNKLYEVGIWPGAGYQLNTYYVYADNEETALDLVVVYLEIYNPSLLSSIQEVEDKINEDYQTEFNNFIDEGEDNDIISFARDYLNLLYIDATMNGATQPYFIESENLIVTEVNNKVENKESNNAKVPEGFKTSKYGKRTEAVTTNETQIANWLKETVEWLVESENGCGTWKLDDRLAICVGWSDGYDENDTSDNYIHSKEDPTYCINAAIKVWTSDDMRTDLDWINYPYDDENTYDDSFTISQNENYNELAKTLLHIYSTYKDCDIDKDGKITSRLAEENKSIKEEARLTDYLGILQIRDILQKNPETANKEFAVLDNMIVEVGVGNDVNYYKATKNADSEWELTKVNNKNENLTENINEDGFQNSKELQDYFEKLNDLPDTIELDNRQYTMTEYGGTGNNSWAVYTDTLNDDSYIRVYYSLGHISDGHYKGIKSINGVSDLRENKQAKTEYYNKSDDEKVIWSSEFDIDNVDKEDLKNNQYQDYLDNFDSTLTPMSYDEWLDSEECSTYFDLEWEDAAHQDDTYADWYSFITDYVSDVEKQEAYNEYVENCKQTTLEPDTFEEWLDNQYNQLADNAWEIQKEDLEQNILPAIDSQIVYDTLILAGYYGSNYPDFKSSGNGGTMFNSIDEFKDYMGEFDETEITTKQGILGAILSDHDGTVSGQLYTLPENLTGLVKALNYEQYVDIPDDITDEKDILETVIDQFEEDLLYGGVDVQDLTNHLDVLVPIKDTISGYTPDEPKGNKTEALDYNNEPITSSINADSCKVNGDIVTGNAELVQYDGSEYSPVSDEFTFEYNRKDKTIKVTSDNEKEIVKDLDEKEMVNNIEDNILPEITKITESVSDDKLKEYASLAYNGYMEIYDVKVSNDEKYETLMIDMSDRMSEELTDKENEKAHKYLLDIFEQNGWDVYTEGGAYPWNGGFGNVNPDTAIALREREQDEMEKSEKTESIQSTADLVTKSKEAIKNNKDLDTIKVELETAIEKAKQEDDKSSVQLLISILETIKDKQQDKDIERENKNVLECNNIKKVEAVEYISKKEYDELPAEYKTTIAHLLKARQAVGDNAEELRKLYKELGYNEEDPMVLVNEQGATVLKPVKVQEEKTIATYKDNSSIVKTVQADNGKYFNYYYDNENDKEHHSSSAGPFNTSEEAETMVKKHRPQAVRTELEETIETDNSGIVKEELNTGVLPIVDVDMYSMEALNEYDVDLNELDNIVMELAPKYIEDTLSEILVNVSVVVKSMYHPKQYNYSGDELEFTLSVDKSSYEILKENTLNNPEFANYLKTNYSSSSGFVSYMADNIDEFNIQDSWKQMVQVIMFNIPSDKIQTNNDQYMSEFMERVSMNYSSVYDDNDNITEAKEPETNQDTTEYKVGDVVEDIVDEDTAVIEAITDNPKTYLLRFVDGECEGEAYKYAEGRFELVTDEARINKAKEAYENGTKKIESLLKENTDSKEELQVKIENVQHKLTTYKEAYRKGTMPKYQYNYLSHKEETKLKDLKTTLNNID